MPTGIWIEVRAVQPVNTVLSANDVRPVGSKMDVRDTPGENTPAFNTVTCVDDKSIKLKISQPPNA
jgi:hypothetical protein